MLAASGTTLRHTRLQVLERFIIAATVCFVEMACTKKHQQSTYLFVIFLVRS
jgi:ATP phosphoribosyltransferase